MSTIVLYEQQLAWPATWTAVFRRHAPLLLEIGFGSGHFLVDLAQKRPAANVLGVDIALPSLRRTVRKVERAGLENVRLLQGNAWFLLWVLTEPQTVQETYINFPDPWPKSGHHHRRLISDRFLHLLATRMAPGGTLDVATDHADYAEVITDCLVRTPYFNSRLATPFVTADAERPRTKYERTAIAAGRTCRYYKWRRNDTAAANTFPIPKEHDMPHIVMQLPLSPHEIAARFQPLQSSLDEIHVRLTAVFQAAHEPRLLVDAYVNEEPLAQRVALEMRQREPGEYVISLHEIGFPRVTDGIQMAVARLAEWAASLHPDAAVLHHNLQNRMWEEGVTDAT